MNVARLARSSNLQKRHRAPHPWTRRIRSQVRWPRVYILYDSRAIVTLGPRNARWYSLCVDHIPLPCLETLLFLRLFHLTRTYVPRGPVPGPGPLFHFQQPLPFRSLLCSLHALHFLLSFYSRSYALILPDVSGPGPVNFLGPRNSNLPLRFWGLDSIQV